MKQQYSSKVLRDIVKSLHTSFKNPEVQKAVRKRLIQGSIAIGGVSAAGLAGGALHKNRRQLKEFTRGWQMGIRDGQLEVQGTKGSPGALQIAAKTKIHGKGYVAGRQHVLSRAGLHGGTASKIGPFETIVKVLKAPTRRSTFPILNQPGRVSAVANYSKSTKSTKAIVKETVAELRPSTSGCPIPSIDQKRPAGTYICPEGCTIEITWRTPQDKYKMRCPKCNTDLILKEKKKNLPAVKTKVKTMHLESNVGNRSLQYMQPKLTRITCQLQNKRSRPKHSFPRRKV